MDVDKSPSITMSLSSNMSSLNVTSEEMAATTKDKIASTMFDFELDFDQWAVEEWVSHNWAWLCLVIGVAYVFLVFLGTNEGISFENMKINRTYSGKAVMDSRQGFKLRYPLALWNASLALFSRIFNFDWQNSHIAKGPTDTLSK